MARYEINQPRTPVYRALAPGTCSYKLHLRTSLGSDTVGMYEPYVTAISESHLRLASVRDPPCPLHRRRPGRLQ